MGGPAHRYGSATTEVTSRDTRNCWLSRRRNLRSLLPILPATLRQLQNQGPQIAVHSKRTRNRSAWRLGAVVPVAVFRILARKKGLAPHTYDIDQDRIVVLAVYHRAQQWPEAF